MNRSIARFLEKKTRGAELEVAEPVSKDKATEESIVEKLGRLNITTLGDLYGLKVDGPMGLLRGLGLDQHEYELLNAFLMHKNTTLKPATAKEVLVQQRQTAIAENEKVYKTSTVFLPGMVTELTGPPWVGKSMLALDLAIRCIVNALERPQDDRPVKALYVDIKKKLQENERRDIENMTRKILDKIGNGTQNTSESQSRVFEVSDVLECLVIVPIDTFAELLNWLESDDFANLTSANSIVVIIIDSLSTLAMVDKASNSDAHGFQVTPDSLIQMGFLLSEAASALDCPVVTSTSVSGGSFRSRVTTSTGVTMDTWEAQFPMTPSLQYCVHTRLVMLFSQYPDLTTGGDSQGSAERCLLIDKHPHLAQRPILFDLGHLEELYNQ